MSAELGQQLAWLERAAGVRELRDQRVMRVQGEDARSWLNGQCTNDVRELGADAAVYALVVNLKGRVLSDLWAVAAADDDLRVVVPESRAQRLLEYLEQFIIMEDVELTLDPDVRVLTIQGPKAAEVADAAQAASGGTARRYACPRLTPEGIDLWATAEHADGLREALGAAAEAAGGGVLDDAGWEAAHVCRGVPRLDHELDERTYPQEAGLRGRALSFDKGCYQGQEVICMLENRGQLKRRLVQLQGGPGVTPGGALRDAQGERVGEVTSSVVTDPQRGSTCSLGYVKRALAAPGTKVQFESQELEIKSVIGGD